MPEKDYKKVKRTVVKVLARRVSNEMEDLEKKKGWNENTYEQWGKGHMRTPYRK